MFLLSDILCGIAKFSRGNKNKLRTFQPQKWKKIKNSQPKTKFTGSYIKKECTTKWINACLFYDVNKFAIKQICLFLFKKGWSLLIRRLSINVTLKTLLLVARIEKSSKSGQNQVHDYRIKMFFNGRIFITFNSFPSAEVPTCSHILTLKWRLVLP